MFAIDVKIASPCRACVIKRTDIQKRLEFNELLGRIRGLDAIRSRVSSLSLFSLPLSLSLSSLVPDARNEAHLVARTRPMARRYGGCGHAQWPIAPRVTQLSAWPRPSPIRTASRMTHSARLVDTPRRQSFLVRAWGECISLARQRERQNGPLIRCLARPARPAWSTSRSPNRSHSGRRIRCASSAIAFVRALAGESRSTVLRLSCAQSVLFLRYFGCMLLARNDDALTEWERIIRVEFSGHTRSTWLQKTLQSSDVPRGWDS